MCFASQLLLPLLQLFYCAVRRCYGCFIVLFGRHADGKVCFWDMNLSAATKLLYCLDTASIYATGTDEQETTGAPADEDWPPFRKVYDYAL